MALEPILQCGKTTPDVHSKLHRNQTVPALVLALVCMGSASMLYFELALFVPHMIASRASIGLGQGYFYGNDFYQIWLTLRESQNGHRDLYSDASTRKIQIGIFGRPLDERNRTDPPVAYRRYVYPAFTNLLLWPSALLEFPTLRLVLTLMFAVLTATSLWMWLKALDWDIGPMWLVVLIIFTMGTHQLLEGFVALQPGLFVGFCLAGAALAIRTRRLMLAGTLCALTLIKPQVTALPIVYLLLWSLSDRTRARLWQAFLAIAAALMLASSLIWPHWMAEWVAVLSGYHLHAPPSLMKVLLGPHVPAFVSTTIIRILLVVAVGTAWLNRHAAADTCTFWITLTFLLALTAITLLHEQAVYDQIILIPGILILLRGRSTARIPKALWYLGFVLLVWPFIAAFSLLLARPFLSPAVFYAPAIINLPVVNEVALPFAVLALLAWHWKTSSALLKTVPIAAAENEK